MSGRSLECGLGSVWLPMNCWVSLGPQSFGESFTGPTEPLTAPGGLCRVQRRLCPLLPIAEKLKVKEVNSVQSI